jgi:hypothetical protein
MCDEYAFEKERNENEIMELGDQVIEKMGLDEALRSLDNTQ